jgi:hypothetical protein
MRVYAFLKARRTPPQRGRQSSRRLLLEYLEDRLVPSIPDGTVLVCTGPSPFSSQDQSSYPIGIIGVDPGTGTQFPVSIDSSQDGNLFTLPTYAIEGPDGQLYITDLQAFGTGAIIRVDPNTGQQFLVTKGQYINGPNTLAWVNGFLYVANEADGSGTVHTIVQVDPNSGAQVLITDGNSGSGFTVPVGMAPGPGNTVYLADEPGGYNGTQPGGVWQVNLGTGQQTLITWGNLIDHPVDVTQDQNGNLVVIGNAVGDTATQRAQLIGVNPSSPDPNGLNQSLLFTESQGYPLDGITEDLNTGILYTGSISYGTNPADLFAVNPTSQTQTTLAIGGQLSLIEGISVYHPVTQTAATATTVTPSINPSVFGQSVAFTATISTQNSVSVTPTGMVQFQIDGNNVGSPVVVTTSNGVTTASFVTSTLPAGTHAITAVYSGDSNFGGSSGSVSGSQLVNPASTSIAVASSGTPSVSGQNVIFTAIISVQSPGSGTPTGTVQFQVDGVNVGSPVSVTSSSGVTVASFSTGLLLAGTHAITAIYSGDSNFGGSNGTLANGQVVNLASTSIAVASSGSPSVSGQSVTFTAIIGVQSPGSGIPSGTVQFQIDGNNLGSPVGVSASSGIPTASMSTSALPAGTHTITAIYSGDGNFSGSSGSLVGGQVVNSTPATTTLSASVSAPVTGQSVSFTATVSAQNPANGTPTGTVQFQVDGSNVGSAVTLSPSGGIATASFSTSSLTAGTHTIAAIYSGDSNFTGSTGTLTQTVNKGCRLSAAPVYAVLRAGWTFGAV